MHYGAAPSGERTALGFFLAPLASSHDASDRDGEEREDRTVVDAPRPAAIAVVDGGGERAVFTAEMLELLRQRLRAAEAREASGAPEGAAGE